MNREIDQRDPCVLDTGGFRVVFGLRRASTSTQHVDAVIRLELSPTLNPLAVQSPPTFIALADLRRLSTYLEEHLARLPDAPDRDPGVFIPLELGFQVHALAGDVDRQ